MVAWSGSNQTHSSYEEESNISEASHTVDVSMPTAGTTRHFECHQVALQGRYNQFWILYLYPAILILGTAGNILNLIVYSHPFLRSSPTVRLLSGKAVANLGHVLSMLLTYVYHVQFHGDQIPVPNDGGWWEWIFNAQWLCLKYTLFANNFFSTLAVWLTVGATGEHFLLVAFPVSGRSWSTMRNSNLFLLLCLPSAMLLHAFILIYYTVQRVPCWYSVLQGKVIPEMIRDTRFKFAILQRYMRLVSSAGDEVMATNDEQIPPPTDQDQRPVMTTEMETDNSFLFGWRHPPQMDVNPTMEYWLELYQTGYFWTSSLLGHILPLIVLSYCSVGIYRKLFVRGRRGHSALESQHNTDQKQCVVRLALATTFSHLLLEMPQVPVFIFTAFKGTTAGSWVHQELVSAVAASTSLLNSSIPFILYLACSGRFRQLTKETFTCKKSGGVGDQNGRVGGQPTTAATRDRKQEGSKKAPPPSPPNQQKGHDKSILPTNAQPIASNSNDNNGGDGEGGGFRNNEIIAASREQPIGKINEFNNRVCRSPTADLHQSTTLGENVPLIPMKK